MKMVDINDLPVDVLQKVVSYTHGEPEYVKIGWQWRSSVRCVFVAVLLCFLLVVCVVVGR